MVRVRLHTLAFQYAPVLVAVATPSNPRDRKLVPLARVLPDADALSVNGGPEGPTAGVPAGGKGAPRRFVPTFQHRNLVRQMPAGCAAHIKQI